MLRSSRIPGLLLGLAAVAMSAFGCSQGQGDRCQVNSDCSSGLECKDVVNGNGTCQSSTSSASQDAAADANTSLATDTLVTSAEAGGSSEAGTSVAQPESDAAGSNSTGLDAEASEAGAMD